MNLDEKKPIAYKANGEPIYSLDDLHKENFVDKANNTNFNPDSNAINLGTGTGSEESSVLPNQVVETPASAPVQPQAVYLARPAEGHDVDIPPEIARKHSESIRMYPNLNLSEQEYVISSFKRYSIGILPIWIMGLTGALALVIGSPFLIKSAQEFLPSFGIILPDNFSNIALLIVAFAIILLATFVYVATYVYNSNHFYLTNESVIQVIRDGLFSKREQTITLGNIEDASYSQKGVMQNLFNYGTIRLSTEGDETTYTFTYTHYPEREKNLLNDAVEAFKLGRKVRDSDEFQGRG